MISRILLVDDDADICEVVTLALGLDPTVVVRSCGSGGEAPAIAAAWTPHLILCDVMMPIMDGPATLTALRKCKRTVKIPVVFMTASAQPREVEHLMSLGANGVITKPFDPMMLPNSLRCQLGAYTLILTEILYECSATTAAALRIVASSHGDFVELLMPLTFCKSSPDQ